ncbi:T9SS type A sorting domain-containing protein [Flavobacterium tegetincola]|uniref:T9SS type A sorting domain-containing protein n=1 Tax=Flavobacterium tegetincola TaxID=150172 RepID=UPI00040ED123|nr:T9SS type A sorting domain-containing protein [Flavobacterium tegetincola]
MHRASNATKFISLEKLEELLIDSYADNIVEVGILNTEFNVLNYNVDEPRLGGMTLDTVAKRFTAIPNTPPFYTMHTLVIAPLMDAVGGADVKFNFSNQFLFTNGDKKITTLDVDFGEGTIENIIDNEIFNEKSVTIQYGTNGTKIIKFLITFDDGTTLETNGAIYFTNTTLGAGGTASCGSTGIEDLRQDFLAQKATELSQGYIATDPKIKAQLDYRVFYSAGNTQKLIKKPLIIIDGFDPGDKRRIQDCDCAIVPKCASQYRGSNGNFDPEKHKSIVDLMMYFENGVPKELLVTLRAEGFDVIVVNFPNYETKNLTNNQNVIIDGGADYIENNAMAVVALLQEIKGQVETNGSTNKTAIISPSMAGQIARYALSYMEKKFEETNNTDWKHNVSLWASLDSPFLGANIPLGDQALIYLLKEEDDAAETFYNQELASPASQQMLIEFHKPKLNPWVLNPSIMISNYNQVDTNFLNGQTTTQGLPLNRGNTYFQQHYNKQFTSGKVGSDGWPQDVRKIAIVNGSLTGSKEALKLNGQPEVSFANDGEKVLNIRGFQRIRIGLPFGGSIVWRIHIASMEVMFMKSAGQGGRIARFKGPAEKTTNATNINSRGVMDNVPGGYYDVQNQLAEPILSNIPLPSASISGFSSFSLSNIIAEVLHSFSQAFGGSEFQLREFNPNNSFIPTFSSLAILNPNQSWATPLNYNLICPTNKLTPFDSYFGIAKNTAHISFTKESKDWLLKELDNSPQAPSFPLNATALTGPGTICTSATYTFGDICKIPSNAVWTKSSNLQITSSNGFSINVNKVGNGQGFIKATFQNGTSVTKNIWVGVPQFNSLVPVGNQSGYNPNQPNISSMDGGISCNGISLKVLFDSNAILEYEWEKITLNVNWGVSPSSGNLSLMTVCNKNFVFKVRARNSCGWSDWKQLEFYMNRCNTDCDTSAPSNSVSGLNFILSPNPVSSGLLTIDIKPSSPWFYPPGTIDPITGMPIPAPLVIKKVNISIFTSSGTLVQSYSNKIIPTQIDISSLANGNYIVLFEHFGATESYNIIKG